MELADVTDSKSVGLITRVGSSPTTGTTNSAQLLFTEAARFHYSLHSLCPISGRDPAGIEAVNAEIIGNSFGQRADFYLIAHLMPP